MARVKIVKGKTVKEVSLPAYLNFFKDSGWYIVGEESLPLPNVEEVAENIAESVVNDADVADDETNDVEDEVADEEWEEVIAEDEVEKPLSDMNRNELIAKAESLGIEVDGKNNKQLREAIKATM